MKRRNLTVHFLYLYIANQMIKRSTKYLGKWWLFHEVSSIVGNRASSKNIVKSRFGLFSYYTGQSRTASTLQVANDSR